MVFSIRDYIIYTLINLFFLSIKQKKKTAWNMSL